MHSDASSCDHIEAAAGECAGNADACAVHDCVPPEARSDGGGQPCPTPLMWQQVLESFREQAAPWQIERGGRTISGRTFGEGPPLYFLNGIGGTHELFALTAWVLRDSFRCVFFDYPSPTIANRPHRACPGGEMTDELPSLPRPSRIVDSVGSSPSVISPPAQGRWGSESKAISPALESLSDDLIAIADHFGDPTISLYATSFGSTVALAAMARFPDRVERTILQGGFATIRLSLAERIAMRAARWLPGRLKHVPMRRLIQQQSHEPWFPPFDQTRFQFFSENTGDVPVAALADRSAALRRLDLRPLLPRIETPILLIRSEGEGRVSTAAHQELQAGLPNSRTEWMFGCGHLPYLTHPHRLAKLITPFLRGEPPAETPAAVPMSTAAH